MTFNLTLHSVVSSIGSRLAEGPATFEELVRSFEGTDGLTGEVARQYARKVLTALRKGGKVRTAGRGSWAMVGA